MRSTAVIAGAALLALGGCVIAIDADEDMDWDHHENGLERLYSANIAEEGVQVRVASNGCTSEDSFDAVVEEHRGSYEIVLERKNPDRCRALTPDGVELLFTWAALGVPSDGEITIVNPVGR
ncbi:MAG: hypothetical protein MI723_07335 [Caulobacterales bacterium]|nr:hypothetical protein [Caulobacterales bacterium]